MSVQIQARLVCDGCGAVIEGGVQTQTAQFPLQSYASAKFMARQKHWMFNSRYGKTKHLCQACADGSPTRLVSRTAK